MNLLLDIFGGTCDILYSLPCLAIDIVIGNILALLGRAGVPFLKNVSFTSFQIYSEEGMKLPAIAVKGGLMDIMKPFARAVTTGRFIQFYRTGAIENPEIRRHEVIGHALAQCRYLGPLYLPVVLLDYTVTLQWLLPVWPGVKKYSLIERWANKAAARAVK